MNVGDTVLHSNEKAVGIGVGSPLAKFHLVNKFETPHHLDGASTFIIGPANQSNQANLRLGVHQDYSWIQSHGSKPLSINSIGNNVGIGNSDPQCKLHIKSNGELVRLEGANHAYISFYQHDDNADRSGYLGYGSSSNNNFYLVNDQDGSMIFRTSNVTRMIISEGGNIGVGITTPDSKLHVNGKTKTRCLEIIGGCDIKEDLNSIEKLQPGDIVVIDDKNPGQIRRTNETYDRKVAGVISGANGINPGISLSQNDVMEGEFPLTMVGRVYVKATGIIQVGDMLTTSHLPGHAMAVSDFSKAHGTVIGKAMSANESGEGMVLVLVNLQ